MFLNANSEESEHTGQIPRLIRVFAGRKSHFVRFVMRRLMFSCTTIKLETSMFSSDVKRNEFLHKFLLKLDPRQHYFVSSLLTVCNTFDEEPLIALYSYLRHVCF